MIEKDLGFMFGETREHRTKGLLDRMEGRERKERKRRLTGKALRGGANSRKLAGEENRLDDREKTMRHRALQPPSATEPPSNLFGPPATLPVTALPDATNGHLQAAHNKPFHDGGLSDRCEGAALLRIRPFDYWPRRCASLPGLTANVTSGRRGICRDGTMHLPSFASSTALHLQLHPSPLTYDLLAN